VKVVKTMNQNTDYGILDVIQLKDGQEYRGKVLNQVMGKSVTIQLSDSLSQTISAAEISSLALDISITEDVFTQIPLLDVLVLRDDSIVTGVINARMMGKYVTIFSSDTHKEQMVELSNIVCYRKVENPDYVTKLADAFEYICVNNRFVEPSIVRKGKYDRSSVYLLVRSMTTIKASDSIVVTFHNMNLDTVMLYKLTEDKSLLHKSHKTHLSPYCKIEDEPYLKSVCTKNKAGDLETSFAIKNKGIYLLLPNNTINNRGLIIKVE
jgi:hypothetical protein